MSGIIQTAADSITQAELADDSVGTEEIIDGDVATVDLADGAVTLAKTTPVQVDGFGLIGRRTIVQVDALVPAFGWMFEAVDGGTPSAGSSSVLIPGDLAEFNGLSWIKTVDASGGAPPAGTVALVAGAGTALFAPLAGGDEGKIATYPGASSTPALESPPGGAMVSTRTGALLQTILIYHSTLVAWAGVLVPSPMLGDGLSPVGFYQVGLDFDGPTIVASASGLKVDDDQIDTTQLADGGVTNVKLADMTQATAKGRADAAGTGPPVDLTAAQLQTIIGVDPPLPVRKSAAGTIARGCPLHAVSWNVSGFVLVEEADASDPSKMPAFTVASEDITNSATVNIPAGIHIIESFDTNAWTESDLLYVAAGGSLTNVKPTGTNLIQSIGEVLRKNPSVGSFAVFGAGRTNDVPNIPNGEIWIGNGSGVATPTELGAALPAVVNTDGQMWLDPLMGIVGSGAWAAAWHNSNLVQRVTPPAAASSDWYMIFSLPTRSTASRGRRITGHKSVYAVDTENANDVVTTLSLKTVPGDNSVMVVPVIQTGTYDSNHDSAAKRGDATGGYEYHTATFTLDTPVYAGDGVGYILRFLATGGPLGTSVVDYFGTLLLFEETLIP